MVAEERAALRRETADRLAEAATAAVTTLVALLDAETPPAVRLGAARSILEFALRHQAIDLEDRLTDLENRLSDQGKAA